MILFMVLLMVLLGLQFVYFNKRIKKLEKTSSPAPVVVTQYIKENVKGTEILGQELWNILYGKK